jgi:hypothetical protein
LIVEDDESDVTNTEVDSSDVNAGNADRPSSKNTVQTLDPAYGLSKPIDPPSPRRLDDIDDEVPSGLALAEPKGLTYIPPYELHSLLQSTTPSQNQHENDRITRRTSEEPATSHSLPEPLDEAGEAGG